MILFLYKTFKIAKIRLFLLICMLFLSLNISAKEAQDSVAKKGQSVLLWIKQNTNAKYSLDGNYSSGNVNRLLVANRLTFNYHFKIYEFNVVANYIYGNQNKIKTEDDYFSGMTASIWHHSSVYIWGSVVAEKSYSRGIADRENAGAGFGVNLIPKEKNRSLSLTFGYVYENTNFIALNDIKTVRTSLRIKGKHMFLKKKIHLNHETFLQPSIISSENYRLRTLISLEIPLGKALSFRSSYQYVYENVVSQGKKKEDNNLTFGFSCMY